jgi:hypothetical protein
MLVHHARQFLRLCLLLYFLYFSYFLNLYFFGLDSGGTIPLFL